MERTLIGGGFRLDRGGGNEKKGKRQKHECPTQKTEFLSYKALLEMVTLWKEEKSGTISFTQN